MATSVEFGPGMRFVAPRRSRNCSRESHRRRCTTSSSMTAMCAAGPPKAVAPRRKNKSPNSLRDAPAVLPLVSIFYRQTSGSTLVVQGGYRQGVKLPAHIIDIGEWKSVLMSAIREQQEYTPMT